MLFVMQWFIVSYELVNRIFYTLDLRMLISNYVIIFYDAISAP